jgi:putative hydrolases of HD superfamily
MKRPSIDRLVQFHELLNAFASIERVVHVKRVGKNVKESDTEHSYNLAMMAWFLADYFPELSKDKVLKLALVHDLVEVHAGDTFAYGDEAHIATKVEREMAAQKQLATEWQDFPELHLCIDQYEERKTPEARFVYALDKIMPMFAIYLNNGHTWKERKLTLERIHAQKSEKVKVSPEIAPYWDELYSFLSKQPDLFGP